MTGTFRWFVGYGTTIKLKKLDRYSESMKRICPYFETWEEAHAHMLSQAEKRMTRAASEVASAQKHYIKAAALVKP